PRAGRRRLRDHRHRPQHGGGSPRDRQREVPGDRGRRQEGLPGVEGARGHEDQPDREAGLVGIGPAARIRRREVLMLMAMLLLAAGTPVASAAASPAPASAVPAEVDRHYREYNFVNAFSTKGERTMIARGPIPSEPRLGRIARAMNRIEARIEEIDPGMVVAMGSPSHETAMRSDLVRLTSWRADKDGDEAWATL